ncbi:MULTISPECIES: DUF4328 domain-containing protein [unclassified Streptomyces]|uniref:DUF4328 domain-containing protein n=1 Tax=unclassified Streptomyces TaxID=2593676 RepID=UPI001F1A3169|nr:MULTISPECIES: DUF4328 domain-containing protein [unclassified Streptomyces]WEH29168.1 DUF4328 domain-containing protein [Streptomyces sp. AM 3-1-1]
MSATVPHHRPPHSLPPAQPPSGGLLRAVHVALALVVAGSVLQFAAALNVRAHAVDWGPGGIGATTASQADVDAFNHAQRYADLTSLLTGVVYVLAAVLFLVWFGSARSAAGRMEPLVFTRGRGWAIGVWFIPFANLALPRRVASEIWNAARSPASESRWPDTGDAVVREWWVLFLVMTLAENAVSRISNSLTDPGELSLNAVLYALVALTTAGAALRTHRFTTRLTEMLRLKAYAPLSAA